MERALGTSPTPETFLNSPEGVSGLNQPKTDAMAEARVGAGHQLRGKQAATHTFGDYYLQKTN